MSYRDAIARFPEGFERFDRTAVPGAGGHGPQPAMRVTTEGRFSLDAATFAALGSPARVLLYWDRDTGEVAMRGVASGGYAVHQAGRRHVVTVVALCRALGLLGTLRALPCRVEDGVLFAETRPADRPRADKESRAGDD